MTTTPTRAAELIKLHLDRLDTAAQQLRQLRQGHQAALDQVHQKAYARTDYGTDVYSGDGRQQVIRDGTAAISAQWKPKLAELREHVDDQLGWIDKLTAEHWPKPATGVEALLARQAMWARSRSLLDANVPVGEVIGDTTDLETLHALRDELPTWARVKGGAADTAQHIVEHIDRQIAHVASKTTGVDLTARYEAAARAAELRPLLDQAVVEITGTGAAGQSGLAAAVEARMAGQSARAEHADLDPPDTATSPNSMRAKVASQLGNGTGAQ